MMTAVRYKAILEEYKVSPIERDQDTATITAPTCDEARPAQSIVEPVVSIYEEEIAASVTAPAVVMERPDALRLAGGPVATTSTPRLRVRGSNGSKNSRLRDNEEEALSSEDDVSPVVSDAGGLVNTGLRSSQRRRRAVEQLEQV